MVVGDDKEKVVNGAEALADYFWEVRSNFEFVAPTATLDKAWKWGWPVQNNPSLLVIWGITQLLAVLAM